MEMRSACRWCDGTEGTIETKNGQDCVYCIKCQRFQYNAPKTETGRAVRSVSTTHAAIKPTQRFRILERSNRFCEICGRSGGQLHVGHAVSVADGHKVGLTDDILNSDENLLALCDECNLGQGRRTLPLRILAGLLLARVRGTPTDGSG